jgi:hypothetical protein
VPLYLPPHGRDFACRLCHDLAYTSSRESRKYDSLYRLFAAQTGYSIGVVKLALRHRRHLCPPSG